MKPAWDKLMAEYEGSTTALIADVDCTGDGRSLCEEQGVEGYPTIKYGDPGNLKEYEGEREYDDMKEFAATKLGPQCSPANMDLCDAAQKALIDKYRAMGKATLAQEVEKIENELKQVSDDFDKAVEKLQEDYEVAEKAKKQTVTDLQKNSGLNFMKAVMRIKNPDAPILQKKPESEDDASEPEDDAPESDSDDSAEFDSDSPEFDSDSPESPTDL